MSAAARRRIAAAQRVRWPKVKGQQKVVPIAQAGKAGKRTMSAAARKRIAAAQRARWAKIKRVKKFAQFSGSAMDKLPFFYYDILSRMVPGAATLAALFMIPYDKMPPSWRRFLVEGQQNWKAVIVPLLLGGLCYIVGVVFEGVDYAFGMKQLVLGIDRKAFIGAWREVATDVDRNRRILIDEHGKPLKGRSADQMDRFRFRLWDTLVLLGGRDSGMGTAFAHCHRFQAEHKMFLHLIYPALFFAGLSVWYGRPNLAWVDLALIPILFYISHLRNVRRWLQVISFSKQLNLIENNLDLLRSPQMKEHNDEFPPDPADLRLEYEKTQDSAEHNDTVMWETAAIIWGANTLLLGFVLEAIDKAVARVLIVLTAVLGILITAMLIRMMKVYSSVVKQKYTRCKKIEESLGMRQHLDTEPLFAPRGMQKWSLVVNWGIIAIWFFVFLKALISLMRAGH